MQANINCMNMCVRNIMMIWMGLLLLLIWVIRIRSSLLIIGFKVYICVIYVEIRRIKASGSVKEKYVIGVVANKADLDHKEWS